ncbi:glycoside hydrolase family 47 protein [Lentithecium fluviatile CBS 122367]|uniref:alpha-1,2-Mannosidase n=1 Tax=Lentithecium fluviatile CBS 122367 TaxID=1168545 RepID=A0A6G1IQE5_9PLEO|nr:glycoside hydrolase family 47 protein [Lentithecium fluviatile CBS 122367]
MRRSQIIRGALFATVIFILWRGFALTTERSTPAASDGLTEPAERAKFIRDAFIHGWRGYRKHAYPHDMLKPLSNKVLDDRSGWGCTTVDGLTAAILLDVPEAVDTALDHISTINWDKTTSPNVGIFGTTIRYLGAMLSAYDLLSTTHKHLLGKDSSIQLDQLLKQAETLANKLSPSFVTPKGINTNFLNATDGNTASLYGINDITAISGLVLEWTRLSDLTGNKSYGDLAAKSMEPLLDPLPNNPSLYPGLLPKHLDIDTGIFNTSDIGGWSHAGGGMYEMLLKLSVYDPKRFGSYQRKWTIAAESTIKYLASHPRGRPDLTFLADFKDQQLLYQQDHSGMFAAASFILGGMVTGEKRFLNFGLDVVNTYVEMYSATVTGIGPESVGWIPATCDTDEETRKEACEVPAAYGDQEKSGFVKRAGFWATNTKYLLRPEVLESLYYAYRATGDAKYRDMSWQIIRNVVKWTKAGSAYAELEDVNARMKVRGTDGRRDWMNSYMLTEVFMYAYIIHLEDTPWQLHGDGKYDWIFSTQAHPLKVAAQS